MRIAFVWTGLTSYMADCWRRLAEESDVNLKVWIDTSSAAAKAVSFDAEKLLSGVEHEISSAEAQRHGDVCVEGLVDWKPDVLFVVGWRSALCRAVVEDARLRNVPKVCCFDMPWRWKVRCILAPLVLGRFLRRYDAAFVPGAVCARYAKWLGFKSIHKGLFAIDVEKFRQPTNYQLPTNQLPITNYQPYFLYVGRNSSEKRLDDLREAHRIYREQGGTYELRMYGKGLEGGFVRPEDVPSLMQGAAAFVLASAFDPWPLVLLEAMSAGCPVVASDCCTNRPELGKNWRVFKCGDVAGLALELLNAEAQRHGADDERVAHENLALARQYDCRVWVGRVKTIVREVVK